MSWTDAGIAADLKPAGLRFISSARGGVVLPLPPHHYSGASCSAEHGRFDLVRDEAISVEDPDLAAKVNADWWQLAGKYGLLDEQREFLLSAGVDDPDGKIPVTVWVRVRLGGTWDVAGSGSDILGSGFAGMFTKRYVPEFTMTSLDGRMMLETTVWGDGTVGTLVVRPDRVT